MARIRTIKPEFWTDETIVQLPFVARLLFIGMWNFADDTGALDYSPERIRLQILPAETDCDITGLIDLLAASGLLDYWVSEDGTQAISIKNWAKHQKIDNPSRKSFIREDYRKKAIPSEERVAVAKKYSCSPGGEVEAACYYCGMPGRIKWWCLANGRPSRWITLSDLEFDHFISEHSGGDNSSKNIVLACRSCNRGKREFDPHQFFAIKNPQVALDIPIEPSPLDQGPGPKDQGSRIKDPSLSDKSDRPPTPVDDIFQYWQTVMQSPNSKLDSKRAGLIRKALAMGYSTIQLKSAIDGCRRTPHNMGQNDRGTKFNGIDLILRSADHIDRFINTPEGLGAFNGQAGQSGSFAPQQDNSAAGRVRAEVARSRAARAAAAGSDGMAMADDVVNVRPQMGEQLRPTSGPGSSMGVVLEGDFQRSD